MKYFSLSNNKFVLLPDLHWIKHSLKSILASDNNIKSLDVLKTTGMFESLLYIEMRRNSIHAFNVTILRHMPKLQTLSLHTNKLTYIDNFRID